VTVTSVTPNSGSTVSPTPITVSGTGFTQGATILIGGRLLQTTFVDASTLRATVPVGLPVGAYGVGVVISNSATNVLPSAFTVVGLGSELFIPIAVKNAGGDDSGIQVQNTGSGSATVYLLYYDQAGNAVAADGPQIVAGGNSWTFYQPAEPSLPSGFDGSAVAHSTQPVAAIVNRVNYTGALASAGSLTVPGASTATQATLPMVYGGLNGYVTTISVQNTGTSQGTYNVTLQPNGFSSPAVNTQISVPPLAVRRIRVGTDIGVPFGFVGNASITSISGSPLIAVAETLNSSTSIRLGYAGASNGATVLNAPLLYKNYGGWESTAQVANMSNATITVNATLRYRDTPQTLGLPPVTLAPGQSNLYDIAAIPNLPDEWVGSAVFTTTGPASATVQEVNSGRATGMQYSAFSAGTSSISIPLIFKDANAWDTGVQVQNLGTIETTLTITYFLPTGFSLGESAVVAPGDSVTFYQPSNPSLPSNLTGSATVTSTGQPIVAIVNEVNYIRGGDAAMAYEGINY